MKSVISPLPTVAIAPSPALLWRFKVLLVIFFKLFCSCLVEVVV